MADDWMTPFEGSGIEWHEGLPSPYEYQESDFAKLCAAVHEYECEVERLREALHRCREDYHAKVIALNERKAGYKLALRTIMDVPSQETLMLNAEARAMYELALRAVEGSWGEPYEEAMIRGKS